MTGEMSDHGVTHEEAYPILEGKSQSDKIPLPQTPIISTLLDDTLIVTQDIVYLETVKVTGMMSDTGKKYEASSPTLAIPQSEKTSLSESLS